MQELEMWQFFSGAMSANGIWFIGYMAAVWLGFRLASDLSTIGAATLVEKAIVTIYCLCVAGFLIGLLIQINRLMNAVAASFKQVGETQSLSAAAQTFADWDRPIMDPLQLVFVVSIVVMQLLRIWTKKSG